VVSKAKRKRRKEGEQAKLNEFLVLRFPQRIVIVTWESYFRAGKSLVILDLLGVAFIIKLIGPFVAFIRLSGGGRMKRAFTRAASPSSVSHQHHHHLRSTPCAQQHKPQTNTSLFSCSSHAVRK